MEVLDAIRARRSVRKFDPAHRMSEAEIERLMQHVILSPTAFNIQNWRFVAVRDPETRARIRDHAWGQKQITEASLLLVLCFDLESWQKSPQRYWVDAPDLVAGSMLRNIRNFFGGDTQLQYDEGVRSCSMAAQTAMLAAKAMGYESCPMDGFDFERVGELINLPPDHRICMMLCIGRPLRPAYPRSGQLPLDEVFMWDGFPDRQG